MTNRNDTRTNPDQPANSGSSFTVQIVRSINEIEPALWDAINAPHGLYWTHRFFKSIESSGVMDASYWYIMFYQDGNLVATAVLSDFIVSLDLLLPMFIQHICNHIRRIRKSFMKLRILFCGIPLSIGKHTLSVSTSTSKRQVIKELHYRMEQIARCEGINYLCWKEFPESESYITKELIVLDYIKALSIPRMTLNIRWPTWEVYVQEMRHSYRRKIYQSLQRLGKHKILSPIGNDDNIKVTYPRLIVSEFKLNHASRMNQLYQEVMKRSTTKLEILNLAFFERTAMHMTDDLVFIGLEDENNIQGAALLGKNGNWLNFLLVGFNYECRDRYQTYFNLLNGIIAYGIKKGYKLIDLGQTTYDIKSRLGGESEEMYFCLKPLSTVTRFILRFLSKLLFPKTHIPSRRVFHNH